MLAKRAYMCLIVGILMLWVFMFAQVPPRFVHADVLKAPNTPGDLDPTFGNGGLVNTGFAGGLDDAYSVVIQSDGKIVVVGRVTFGSDSDFGLARYNTNGTLDSSFGNGGLVNTGFAGGYDEARSVVLQSDGKIIVVGRAIFSGDADFGIARYNPNGSLDTSFGNGGLVNTGFAGGLDEAQDVALQPDGKIVVAGLATFSGDADFGIARYNPNGSLDNSFGNGGLVNTGFAGGYDEARSVVLQSDGKIIVAGLAGFGGDTDFGIARYNPNGSLDTSFGNGGLVNTGFAGGYDEVYNVILQPDGKIIVAGRATFSGDQDFGIVRYNANGSPDASFGNSGLVNLGFAGGHDEAWDVALQSDGKIIVVGLATFSGDADFGLARYNPNGSLDTSFGNGGLVNTGFAGGDDWAHSVALQPDGKIVVAGHASFGIDYDFALARYEGHTQSTLSQRLYLPMIRK